MGFNSAFKGLMHWKGSGRKRSCFGLNYCLFTFWKYWRYTTKNIRGSCLFSGQNL